MNIIYNKFHLYANLQTYMTIYFAVLRLKDNQIILLFVIY